MCPSPISCSAPRSPLPAELPPAEQEQMENENPLEERFRAEVTVNGQPVGKHWLWEILALGGRLLR